MKPTTQRRNPATLTKPWRRRVGSVTIPFWASHLTLLSLVWFSLTELSTGEEKWNVPRVGHKLTFPRDHGSHTDFKIEWWYLTGHLFSDTERFGFQATFFRLGQRPEDVPKDELFGDEQIYMAHMGISHPDTNTFLHEERLNRGGWDARASLEGLNVKNGNWKLVEKGGGMELVGSVRSEASYKLRLRPHKQHVIFGEEGISRKGPEGTASSYYITFPRLNAEGEISFQGEIYSVAGEAWMDHEISSSQLDRNQIGWDWACLQFYDGREIMGYVLRTDSGEPSEYSKLVWIDPTGNLRTRNWAITDGFTMVPGRVPKPEPSIRFHRVSRLSIRTWGSFALFSSSRPWTARKWRTVAEASATGKGRVISGRETKSSGAPSLK